MTILLQNNVQRKFQGKLNQYIIHETICLREMINENVQRYVTENVDLVTVIRFSNISQNYFVVRMSGVVKVKVSIKCPFHQLYLDI